MTPSFDFESKSVDVDQQIWKEDDMLFDRFLSKKEEKKFLTFYVDFKGQN